MTDDFVKRLDAEINATYGKHPCGLLNEAKMRIERLENEVKRLEQQLKMARRLAHRSQPEYPPEIGVPHLRED